MARCIQHECDHLDGHIYIDRLDRPTRKKALRDIRKAGFCLPEVDQSAKRAGKCPAFPGALLYPVSTSCVLVSAHFVATSQVIRT